MNKRFFSLFLSLTIFLNVLPITITAESVDPNLPQIEENQTDENSKDEIDEITGNKLTEIENLETNLNTRLAGIGTKENPFTIQSAEQLYNLSTIINTKDKLQEMFGITSVHIVLSNDINLINYDNWLPIGGAQSPFNGSFDGNGFTIENLTINTPTATDNIDKGLFGWVDNAEISNLYIDNVQITSNRFIGSLAGVVKNTIIKNVHATGALEGTLQGSVNASVGDDVSLFLGGLTGRAYDNSLIDNVSFIGTVVSTGSPKNDSVGGLIGALRNNSTLVNSFSKVDVKGREHVGGLVGDVKNSDINNSYSTGYVQAFQANAGGIAGILNGGTIEHVYSTATVFANEHFAGGIVGLLQAGEITNTFALNETVKSNSEEHRIVAQIRSGQVNNNFAYSDIKKRDGNAYISDVTLNDIGGENKTSLEIEDATIWGQLSFDTGIWNLSDGFLPRLSLIDIPQDTKIPFYINRFFYDSGSGTILDPYIISTPEQLKMLSDQVALGNLYANEYFQLSNDIDLSKFSSWKPIGSDSNVFRGHFDGNFFTIKNLTINEANSSYKGLFGRTHSTSFKNLNLESVNISGKNRVGALVGHADDASISNVSVKDAKIQGASIVGGVAGCIQKDQSIAEIHQSSFIGDIKTSGSSIGGIVGQARAFTIKNSYTQVDINKDATLDANSYNIGGIIGFSDVNNPSYVDTCYTTGNLKGDENIGGIIGNRQNQTNITNCVALQNKIERISVANNKTVGRIFFIRTGGTTLNNYAFNNMDVVGGDVTLASSVENGSDGENIGYSLLNKSFWEGKAFFNSSIWSIDNNQLPVLSNNNLSAQGGTMPSYISGIQISPTFEGNGDSTSPYLIKTVTDIELFATLVNSGMMSSGAHFKLENDIDLKNVVNWPGIGSETNPFDGIFTGNNKVVSNIKIDGLNKSGLFGVTDGATIEKIAIQDIRIKNSIHAGALIGEALNTSVSEVYVAGINIASSDLAGGLIGLARNTAIINTYTKGNVSSKVSAGIIGEMDSSHLSKSYTTTIVNGTNISGGLVGEISVHSLLSPDIKDSSALNERLTESVDYGRVVGKILNTDSLSNNTALGNMQKGGGQIINTTIHGESTKNGRHILSGKATLPFYWIEDKIGDANFSNVIWIVADGHLPILRGFTDQYADVGPYMTVVPAANKTTLSDGTVEVMKIKAYEGNSILANTLEGRPIIAGQYFMYSGNSAKQIKIELSRTSYLTYKTMTYTVSPHLNLVDSARLDGVSTLTIPANYDGQIAITITNVNSLAQWTTIINVLPPPTSNDSNNNNSNNSNNNNGTMNTKNNGENNNTEATIYQIRLLNRYDELISKYNVEKQLQDKLIPISYANKKDGYKWSFQYELLRVLQENNPNGILFFKTLDIDYALPYNIFENIIGFDSYKLKDDDEIVINLLPLLGADKEQALADFMNIFPDGNLASEFYCISIYVKHANGQIAKFSLDRIKTAVKINIKSHVNTNAILRYDKKDKMMYFVPSVQIDIQQPSGMTALTKRHDSVYMAVNNHVKHSDVSPNTWFAKSIFDASNRALVVGTGQGEYRPNEKLTRAQAAQMFANIMEWRDETSISYKDIDNSSWYFGAVSAIDHTGILSNSTKDLFDPYDFISRQELCATTVKFIKSQNNMPEIDVDKELFVYSDNNDIDNLYKNDIAILTHLDIVTGRNDSKFDASSSVTRAEATLILNKMLKYLKLID